MKVYVAGPVTGYAEGNKPLFDKVTAELREKGHEVISPIEMDAPGELSETLDKPYGNMYWHVLGRDVTSVGGLCDTIVFLPGWEQSKGARLEAFVGLLQNHSFLEYGETLEPVSPEYVAGVCAAKWMPKEVKKLAHAS